MEREALFIPHSGKNKGGTIGLQSLGLEPHASHWVCIKTIMIARQCNRFLFHEK
jgi:hypothetical protein